MVEIVPGLLFILSSGLLFNKRFRESKWLVGITGIVALVASYFLMEQIVDRIIDSRIPKTEKPSGEIGELAFWQTIASSNDADSYRAYLKRFPHGAFVDIASARLKRIDPPKEASSSTAAPAKKDAETASGADATKQTDPQLLGKEGAWLVLKAASSTSVTCYALSRDSNKSSTQPIDSRGPALLVSYWPSRNSTEVEVVSRYRFAENSKAVVTLGNATLSFFTKNFAEGGSAWNGGPSDEQLIEKMKSSSEMVVTGRTEGGLAISNSFPLGGLAAAVERIHKGCGAN